MNFFIIVLFGYVKCNFSRFYREDPVLDTAKVDRPLVDFLSSKPRQEWGGTRAKMDPQIRKSMNKLAHKYLRLQLRGMINNIMGNWHNEENKPTQFEAVQKPFTPKRIQKSHKGGYAKAMRTKSSPTNKNRHNDMRRRLFLHHHQHKSNN